MHQNEYTQHANADYKQKKIGCICIYIGLNKSKMKCTHWPDYVRNMRHRGAGGSSQVHDLCSRLDMDLVHSSQNSCSQLGAEWIPGSVFNLCLSFLKKRII